MTPLERMSWQEQQIVSSLFSLLFEATLRSRIVLSQNTTLMFPFERALNLPVPGTSTVSMTLAGENCLGNVTNDSGPLQLVSEVYQQSMLSSKIFQVVACQLSKLSQEPLQPALHSFE